MARLRIYADTVLHAQQVPNVEQQVPDVAQSISAYVNQVEQLPDFDQITKEFQVIKDSFDSIQAGSNNLDQVETSLNATMQSAQNLINLLQGFPELLKSISTTAADTSSVVQQAKQSAKSVQSEV